METTILNGLPVREDPATATTALLIQNVSSVFFSSSLPSSSFPSSSFPSSFPSSSFPSSFTTSSSDTNFTSTSRVNTTLPPPSDWTAGLVAEYVVRNLLAVLMVVVNGLVLVTLATTPSLRCASSWVIGSLAVTDLLVGLVSPGGLLIELQVLVSPFMCRLGYAGVIALASVSINHLLFISVDRYLHISKPLRYPRLVTKRRVWVFIALCWLWATALSLSFLLGLSVQPAWDGRCLAELMLPLWFLLLLFLLHFMLPLLVMLYVHAAIFRVARRQQRAIHKNSWPAINALQAAKVWGGGDEGSASGGQDEGDGGEGGGGSSDAVKGAGGECGEGEGGGGFDVRGGGEEGSFNGMQEGGGESGMQGGGVRGGGGSFNGMQMGGVSRREDEDDCGGDDSFREMQAARARGDRDKECDMQGEMVKGEGGSFKGMQGGGVCGREDEDCGGGGGSFKGMQAARARGDKDKECDMQGGGRGGGGSFKGMQGGGVSGKQDEDGWGGGGDSFKGVCGREEPSGDGSSGQFYLGGKCLGNGTEENTPGKTRENSTPGGEASEHCTGEHSPAKTFRGTGRDNSFSSRGNSPGHPHTGGSGIRRAHTFSPGGNSPRNPYQAGVRRGESSLDSSSAKTYRGNFTGKSYRGGGGGGGGAGGRERDNSSSFSSSSAPPGSTRAMLRAARLLALPCGFFYLSWAPWFITMLWAVGAGVTVEPHGLERLVQTLAILNSLGNPVLYAASQPPLGRAMMAKVKIYWSAGWERLRGGCRYRYGGRGRGRGRSLSWRRGIRGGGKAAGVYGVKHVESASLVNTDRTDLSLV